MVLLIGMQKETERNIHSGEGSSNADPGDGSVYNRLQCRFPVTVAKNAFSSKITEGHYKDMLKRKDGVSLY